METDERVTHALMPSLMWVRLPTPQFSLSVHIDAMPFLNILTPEDVFNGSDVPLPASWGENNQKRDIKKSIM